MIDHGHGAGACPGAQPGARPGSAGAWLPLLALLLPLVTCSDAGAPGSAEPIVRDSAGVTIVEHPAGAGPAPTWRADFDAATALAGDFFQVAGAFRLADGRIAVAERGERRITVFEPDGSRGPSFGGEGEGPGEFRQLNNVFRWPGDSILVFDIQLRRLTLFDHEGRVGRTFQLEVTEEAPFGAVQGVHGDGTILATGFTQSPPGGPEDGRRRYPSPVHVFAPDGTLGPPIPFATDAESYYRTIEGGFSLFPTLFARRTRAYAGPDFILRAANDAYEIRLHTLEGELRRIVRRTGVDRPITPQLRREAVERTLAGDRSNRDPAELRLILESMPVPETLPAFDRIVVDRHGRIWVEDYEPAPVERSTWRVFDAEGAMAAHAELPRRFQPMEIGDDYLLGVLTDELDVERVVRVPMER
jgi:hypothetical protein